MSDNFENKVGQQIYKLLWPLATKNVLHFHHILNSNKYVSFSTYHGFPSLCHSITGPLFAPT